VWRPARGDGRAVTDVVVIGGGIVGACCALELARDGARVTVLERGGGWGEGCSWGNAGLLVPSHARPIAAPENLRAGLRWMLRRDSPFGMRPRPSLAPWLLRYARASTAARAAAGEALQRTLSVEGLERFEQLDLDAGFKRAGCLTVYTGADAERRAAAEAATETGRALGASRLTAAEARDLEPALSAAVKAAVLFPDEAQCNPTRLTRAVGAAALEHGAQLRTHTEALEIRAGSSGATAGTGGGEPRAGSHGVIVRTSDGDLRAAHVVVAAGAWSGRLAASLGISVPLVAGKGYAVDWAADASPLRIPLYLHDERCVANPMGDRLRVTGGLVLGGLQQRGDPRRVAGIHQAASTVLNVAGGGRSWSGLRPCTPDGLPVIGAHPRAERVLFATGHGMLGVTLGPLTGRLIADLAKGTADHPALGALSPTRFGR
jgi:D-amino-acid dehydrogenase